ncbi:hypothetical protein [Polynucleobacter sp. AP-Sving-400A-A2]|uniref:hypothetical protein n=1 Tax=Polynucleobacter sp. AP-Sving-400A-A2 TaxID=2081049 RepID=UPI001BFD75B1|nr:hypothetical protein [Polynucleobacter sp. AP-Sving-400A-A2]QWE15363.1 hypothetical protein C2758_04350 [Polynucleobacter sp. AP-Sving-400A-A2]
MKKILIFVTCVLCTGAFAQGNKESFEKMGYSIGRMGSVISIVSSIVPACQSSNMRGFYLNYGNEFLEKLPPIMGSIKEINTALITKRQGEKSAITFNKVLDTEISNQYEEMKQKFKATPRGDLDQVCKNFYQLIKDGDFNFYMLAEDYFNELNKVDAPLYESNKNILRTLIIINNNLSQKTLKI